MKKHTRVMATAITAMLVASVFVGCGKKDPVKDDGAGKSTVVPSNQKLLIWSHLDADFPELKAQAEKWAKQTNNQVTVVKDNNDMDKLLVAAKSPTAPDVMWGLPHDHLGKFAAASILDEIGTDVVNPSEYLTQAIVDTGKYNGKQYGIPIFSETYAVFYNKEKHPTFPATWEDMIKAGKVQWDLTNFYFSYGILATGGNYVFKDNGAGSYDVKDVGLDKVEGYQTLEQLVKDGHVDKNTTGDVPKNNFKAGKADFYISGPWDVKDITDSKLNFGLAPIPTINGKPGKSFMGIQMGYVVKKANRNADQKAALTDLLKFLSTKESLAAVGKAGSRLPVKKGIEVNATQQVFLDQLTKAEPMPNVPQMGSVWDPAKAGLTLLLKGDKNAADTAAYVKAEVLKKINQ